MHPALALVVDICIIVSLTVLLALDKLDATVYVGIVAAMAGQRLNARNKLAAAAGNGKPPPSTPASTSATVGLLAGLASLVPGKGPQS